MTDLHTSRREFLRQCACVAGGVGFASTFGSFQLASAAVGPGDAFNDYRALVCVFLFGGNDSFNMFVPTGAAAYQTYADSRQNLAIPQANLLGVAPLGQSEPYGFHSDCAPLQRMFNSGQLAVVSNVGPLLAPTTRAQYQARSVPLPPRLFSHNDQQAIWQTLQANAQVKNGWAGRVADRFSQVIPSAQQQFATNISLSGTNLFQTGATSAPYGVSASGVPVLRGLRTSNTQEAARRAVFESLLSDAGLASRHPFLREFSQVQRRARDQAETIGAALDALTPLTTTFPTSRLGGQLEMVARLIAIRSTLTVRRQIFFVGMGGWDTHGDQARRQPQLLSDLSQALEAFNLATTELGLNDQIVTFTNSDFGRTLTSNGDGSDHGWGGHSLVMGGSVIGQRLYGTFPSLEIGGPDDARGGRLIPTTSADQYGATIARWFGMADADLNAAFPNLSNFTTRDLGFMTP
jgi:uncharacterized protein (DUF1501 family)